MSIVRHASLYEAMTDPAILGRYFSSKSWFGWRTLAKAIDGETLTLTKPSSFTPSPSVIRRGVR
jgi:hypothetical protein